MKQNTTFTTAILLPIITSLAAYIALFSYSNRPNCSLSRKGENDFKILPISSELMENIKRPMLIKPFDEVTIGFSHTSLH